MISTLKRKLPKPPSPVILQDFGGLDLSGDGTQIDERRSPDMLNMISDDLGALDKRPGYIKVFTSPVDYILWSEAVWATDAWAESSATSQGVNGLFNYHKQDGTDLRLMAHDQNLYVWDDTGTTATLVYSGLANHQVNTFVINDKMYLLDGTNYLQYDGSTVSQVTSIAYVPTLTQTTPNAGGGTPYEDFNLLTPSFKQSFSANGTTASFQLALTNLDATTVSAVVNGVAKAETTDFTVNRTAGTVLFNSVPATGTDNVVIQAAKTQSGFADRVKKCQFATLFGGSNDTRVFISGNPDFICQDWRSGLYDPTYFPENGYYRVGSTNEAIMGYSQQYDTLIIHKERTTWQRYYESTSGSVSFPLKPINDAIGCVARKSLQIIENNPTFLTKNGVYQLTGGSVRDERNMTHISLRVDKKLFKEANLENAISIDFDRRYWLVVNDHAYVFDYRKDEWFYFDNITANCFLEFEKYLYFGSADHGLIYKFKKADEISAYYDDGALITAYWKSKLLNMQTSSFRKTVSRIFTTIKPATNTSADIYYITDKIRSGLIKTVTLSNIFSYLNYQYTNWTYGIDTGTSKTKKTKLKAKKFVFFQLEYLNDVAGESLGIISSEIDFDYISQVK